MADLLTPFDQPAYGYRPASNDPPAVSIVTPYYNTGPMFLQTIDAVLRQSLQQWEWIIVNDGSTDELALRTLLPLRSADARIKVIDQPNLGPGAARNTGVAASQAPLIFFLDSDNLLAPTALEQLAWTMVGSPQIAFVSAWRIGFGTESIATTHGFDSRHMFPYDNVINSQSMVRREAFEAAGKFDESIRLGLEDYEFWVRAAAKGLWGSDVHEYLIWDRRKALEEYTSYRWDFRENPQAIPTMRAQLRTRYPELFRNGPPNVGVGGGLLDTYATIPTELPFRNRMEKPAGQRRILILLPSLNVGGADRFAIDLAAGLITHGERVSVCLMRDMHHTWLDEIRRVTPDTFNLPAFLRPADYPRFLHYLIESRQITHVLISSALLGYQLLPYLRSYCPDVAYVDYLHIEQEQRNGGFPRVGLEHDELLDMHIVSSNHLRNWMIERGASPERMAVCTINIDTRRWTRSAEEYAQARAELGIPDDRAVILFAGRLSAQKRPYLVIELMRRLRDSGARFIGILAGDGEDMPWIRWLVRSNRLEQHVRLLGSVPYTHIHRLLTASDILLLPSQHEGIALILFEALAMGVVPVAADVGGQRELVTPECGVLIPHGDTELDTYESALQRLIADPDERTRMACAGQTRVAGSFRLDQMITRMIELFDRATADNCANPRPIIGQGAGLAVATLAIEHEQLETRLRALPPVRALLFLRWSSAGRLYKRLRQILPEVRFLDRKLYVARREIMQRIRKLVHMIRRTG